MGGFDIVKWAREERGLVMQDIFANISVMPDMQNYITDYEENVGASLVKVRLSSEAVFQRYTFAYVMGEMTHDQIVDVINDPLEKPMPLKILLRNLLMHYPSVTKNHELKINSYNDSSLDFGPIVHVNVTCHRPDYTNCLLVELEVEKFDCVCINLFTDYV